MGSFTRLRKSAWWGTAVAVALLVGTGVGPPQAVYAGERSVVPSVSTEHEKTDAPPADEAAAPRKGKSDGTRRHRTAKPDAKVSASCALAGLARIPCCADLAREECCADLGRTSCDPPVLTLEFYDSQMDDNDTTALVIDMDRTDTTLAVDELGYTIDLPDGLVVADSAEGNLTCEGTVGADYGDTSVTVSGASIIAGNGNCRLIVSVTAEASGTYSITGADVTGLTGGLTNDVSTATLIVNPALPQLGARFEPSSINVLTTSTLWLELGRTDKSPTAVASGLGYTLSLPAGLVVGPGGVGSDCGGNATATPGGTSVVLSGGALLAGDRYCEVAVPVKATSSGEHALDYSSLISVTGVDENLAHGCLSSGGEIVAQGEGCLPTLTANKLAQTIMFTQPSDRSVTAGPVALTTSASSELTVGRSSTTPQVCTVSGATVTPIGPGTCSISANQAGNDIYEAAEELTRTFTITGASLSAQTITFSPPSSVALSDGTRTLSASASSGLTVTFVTSTPLVCTVSGSTLTLLTTGVCVIQAQQSGNGSYTAATPVTRLTR